MAHVTHAERVFLQFAGKRLLRYSCEARARGEEYHDLMGYAPLQCGALAKYVFEEIPGGYRPVVRLKAGLLDAAVLPTIAEELLEAPSVLRVSSGNDLEYVRAKDVI